MATGRDYVEVSTAAHLEIGNASFYYELVGLNYFLQLGWRFIPKKLTNFDKFLIDLIIDNISIEF